MVPRINMLEVIPVFGLEPHTQIEVMVHIILKLDNLDKKCRLGADYSCLGLSVRPVKEKSSKEENLYLKKHQKGCKRG